VRAGVPRGALVAAGKLTVTVAPAGRAVDQVEIDADICTSVLLARAPMDTLPLPSKTGKGATHGKKARKKAGRLD
jgi:hypothetical protein